MQATVRTRLLSKVSAEESRCLYAIGAGEGIVVQLNEVCVTDLTGSEAAVLHHERLRTSLLSMVR
jgi:hypothetical protein